MKNQSVSFPVTLPTTWQSPSKENLSQLPVTLKDWLLDESSLTARLKRHCHTFRVEVIGEQQTLCTELEANGLIKVGESVLVREVLLYCDDEPQVFARSLLPLSSLTGKEEALAKLGNQPLGQVLFNNPSLQRNRLELSAFSLNSTVGTLVNSYQALKQKTAELPGAQLWGRRSIFMLENKPLMVAEVFLPGAFAYRQCATQSL